MKHARGNVRKLLIAIGEIQDRVGLARELHYNDRDLNGFEKAQKLLDVAFKLCIEATADYYPVDIKR